MVSNAPNLLYSNSMKGKDIWEEAGCFSVKTKIKTTHMNLKKLYTEDEIGLLIDLHSVTDQALLGSGTHLVNTRNGVQL